MFPNKFYNSLSNKFKDEFLDKVSKKVNDKTSKLHKPFDGDAFGKVIRDLKTNNQFTYKELNSEKMSKSPFNHIFKNKMKHYKAKRKNTYNEQ